MTFIDRSGWDILERGSQCIVHDSNRFVVGYVRRMFMQEVRGGDFVPSVEVQLPKCIYQIPSRRAVRIINYAGWRWFRLGALEISSTPKPGEDVLVWSIKAREYRLSRFVARGGDRCTIEYEGRHFEVDTLQVHMRLRKRGKAN